MIELVAPLKGTFQAKVMKFIIGVHVVKDNHLFADTSEFRGNLLSVKKRKKKENDVAAKERYIHWLKS